MATKQPKNINQTLILLAIMFFVLGGLGNDTIRVTNALVSNATSIATDININSGDGNDVVTISNSKIGNDVIVSSGIGNDTVTATGLTITDDLSITDTAGTNAVRVAGSTTRDDVTLTLGTGNDTLTMTGVTSLGKVDINFGDGNNLLSMSKIKAFGTAPSTLLVFADGIRVISGTGTDKIGIIECETAGVIRIDAGDGTNRVELTRVTTTTRLGTLDIVTGAGADGVTLDRISIGSDSVIDTGLGDDIFTLKNSRLIGDFDASLNDGNDLAYVGSNVFTSLVSYTFNGGLGGATLGFDTLRLGTNTPVNLAAYLNFEVTLLATF